MLRNPDGTPYQASGSIQQFNPTNPAHCLFQLWDKEAIRMGGSPIFYYEKLISAATIDPVWRESRSALYSPIPIQLWCFYEPIASQYAQTAFGIDSPDEMIFEFNYQDIMQSIGHEPKIGSRLFTPHKREDWEILSKKTGEFKLWGQLRMQLLCERFREGATRGEGKVTQKKPDFKIEETG